MCSFKFLLITATTSPTPLIPTSLFVIPLVNAIFVIVPIESDKFFPSLASKYIHTFKCPECSKCFLSKAALRSHHDSHNNNKPYSCDECSIMFSTKQHHNNHLASHKTPIMFNCTICNIVFPSRSVFNRHSREHYIDHFSLVSELVTELVDAVVPVKCNTDCPHCIILKNTEFFIEILMKERD